MSHTALPVTSHILKLIEREEGILVSLLKALLKSIRQGRALIGEISLIVLFLYAFLHLLPQLYQCAQMMPCFDLPPLALNIW